MRESFPLAQVYLLANLSETISLNEFLGHSIPTPAYEGLLDRWFMGMDKLSR